jgi:hypothetical protein
MAARETALKRVAAINKRLASADERRKAMARDRDEAMREANAAGATWADLQATGVSKATIASALNPKR